MSILSLGVAMPLKSSAAEGLGNGLGVSLNVSWKFWMYFASADSKAWRFPRPQVDPQDELGMYSPYKWYTKWLLVVNHMDAFGCLW